MTTPEQQPLSPEKAAAMESLDAQLSLLWRRARAINQELTRSVHPDMEPAAYGLLSVLLHQGAMRLTELAKCIGVGKPSVSRQVTFLQGLGLVQKENDPGDGRAQLIDLTEPGRERLLLVQGRRQALFHARLSHWDEAELGALATSLAKLNEEYLN
ncbi:MarR family winged helix-turn-helix transcriptional regulator [Arthrobacter sp. HLT1-20]